MSAMLMQIMMLVQMTVVYNTAVHFGGEKQIALMGAAQRVMQLFMLVLTETDRLGHFLFPALREEHHPWRGQRDRKSVV